MYCSKCGSENNKEASYCNNCGESLSGKEIDKKETRNKTPKFINNMLMGLIILGLLIHAFPFLSFIGTYREIAPVYGFMLYGIYFICLLILLIATVLKTSNIGNLWVNNTSIIVSILAIITKLFVYETNNGSNWYSIMLLLTAPLLVGLVVMIIIVLLFEIINGGTKIQKSNVKGGVVTGLLLISSLSILSYTIMFGNKPPEHLELSEETVIGEGIRLSISEPIYTNSYVGNFKEDDYLNEAVFMTVTIGPSTKLPPDYVYLRVCYEIANYSPIKLSTTFVYMSILFDDGYTEKIKGSVGSDIFGEAGEITHACTMFVVLEKYATNNIEYTLIIDALDKKYIIDGIQ